MKKLIFVTLVCCFLAGCKHSSEKTAPDQSSVTRMYAANLKDSFSVFIQLPEGYDAQKKINYPVVYLLDANLYFDIMAVTFKKYSEVGLLAPAILVGIGYKDFKTMDSLRNRDYTYPAVAAEYGSGKANQFLAFITGQVVPYVDANYASDQKSRVLMGHSLGGYFTLYALQQAFVNKAGTFNSYIAASPSLEYNHNYLCYEFEKLSPEEQANAKIYITYGGLEDAEDGERDSTQLSTPELLAWATASIKTQKNIHCRGDVYSNLGHMDMPLPSFVRGLQWALNMTEE